MADSSSSNPGTTPVPTPGTPIPPVAPGGPSKATPAAGQPLGQFDLLARRRTHFVLWQPGAATAPTLVIGTIAIDKDSRYVFTEKQKKPLSRSTSDLWELKDDTLGLPDGIYHYWYEVTDTSPEKLGR